MVYCRLMNILPNRPGLDSTCTFSNETARIKRFLVRFPTFGRRLSSGFRREMLDFYIRNIGKNLFADVILAHQACRSNQTLDASRLDCQALA